MYLDPKEKQEIFAKHGKSAKDTGNTEAQMPRKVLNSVSE
jgi:ribosomal protein S15P/S13E